MPNSLSPVIGVEASIPRKASILELNGRISSSPDRKGSASSSIFSVSVPRLSPSSSSTVAGDDSFYAMGSRPTTPGNPTQRSAVQISWNKTITSATVVSDITDLMYLYGNQFNAVNIATSLHRLASQFRFDVRRYSEAIRIVLDRARDSNFEGFSPRELANVVWAMAKTEMPCKEEVFDHVSRKAISSFTDSDYTPQAIANLLWGMAKAGYPNAALFDHLSGIAVRTGLRGFNAQNLSNTLWALSTAQLPNAQLFNMIGDFIVAEHNNLKGFSPQNMANAVWAMAKVNMPHMALFELISRKATESRLAGFKPQEIANLVWAMSVCRLTRVELLAETLREIVSLSEWKPQEIANLVWAVAVGKDIDPDGFAALVDNSQGQSDFRCIVVDEVERRGIAGWKSTELSNLMYGLVFGLSLRSGHGAVLIPSVLAKVRRDGGFSEWKQAELTNFVAALVELNIMDSEILILIAMRAAELYGQEPAVSLTGDDEQFALSEDFLPHGDLLGDLIQ
jgi:hypothetical protein